MNSVCYVPTIKINYAISTFRVFGSANGVSLPEWTGADLLRVMLYFAVKINLAQRKQIDNQ